MVLIERASRAFLWRHPWQLSLAVLGIAVGVAVIVAVDLSNASSRKAFLLSMETLNGSATHQLIGGPRGVDERVYTRLRVDHGLLNIAPIIEGIVEIGGTAVSVLGVDIFAERGFRSYSAPQDAGRDFGAIQRLLTEPGAALMSTNAALLLGIEIGEPFAATAGGVERVGFAVSTFGTETSGGDATNLLVVDVSTAQEWFGRDGYLSRIDVRLSDEAAEAQFRRLLPDGVQLFSAAVRTQSRAAMTDAFMTNLKAMSLLALLVGVFLIYNSVGFTVVQRRGLIGILRALGLTRAETFGVITRETLLLGSVGAGLGLVIGVVLGEQLLGLVSRSINDLYFRVTVTDVAIDGWSLAKGFAVGMAATLVAAAVPAYEAASVQPALTLTRSALERSAGRWVGILLAVGMTLIALAWVLLTASGPSLIAGLTALFLLIIGGAFCIPYTVRVLARVFSPLAAIIGGTPGRLAVDGIAASLSRTGVAVVALTVAVSATIGVTVMVDSFRGAVSEWLDQSLQSDIYVAVSAGAISPSIVADIRRMGSVRDMSTRRIANLETRNGVVRIVAASIPVSSDGGTELRPLPEGQTADDAWRAFRTRGAVFVSDPFAYRSGVTPGDRIELPTERGVRSFPVAAVYRSYEANQGTVLMSRATFDRHWTDANIDSIGLYLQPGVEDDEVIDSVRAISAGRQALLISSNAALRELSLRIFDRTFIITDVLYWLAIGVAIVGIFGAMLALQLERGRELAILRALGLTPAQLGGVVVGQTGVIGLLAGLAAIPLGLVMAIVLIDVINRRSYGWQMDLNIDPAILVQSMCLAVGAALAAGVYPAFRAARANPSVAMREE